jgi:hypothetical protein
VLLALALAGTMAATAPAAAAPASLVAEPLRENKAIVVDGVLEEEVWTRAAVATDFTQQEPDDGAPARERTEVRIA